MNRRDFLWQSGGGLGGVALAALLGADGLLAADATGNVARLRPDGGLHHAPKARRVVQLFMAGAASHIDLFDFKPELIKRHGQPSDFGERVETFQDGLGPWLRPVFDFRPHGSCGKMLGDAVAPLGAVVDDIAFIHNVVGKTGVHSQGTLLQTTGFIRPGFPAMGSWVCYGLGRLTDNLPAFVVLPDPRGLASNGTKNWDAAFLSSFGRMPSSQGGKGRDHNPYCFTNWLAGGGIKGGISHGRSDEFGYKPLDRKNPTEVYDIHATILHLLGIDHTKLSVRHDGIDRRLTDVHGHVIRDILV